MRKDKNINKDDKKKLTIKRLKWIVIIFSFISVVLMVVAYILIYVKLHDSSRNTYKAKGIDSAEIIKKNYIDGFSSTSSSGEFSFSLPEDDVNELLSKSVDAINDKYIKSICYSKGEENHHYFYFDLKLPLIKSRVVLDTLSQVDNQNNCYYLTIVSYKMGQVSPVNYLKEKGYISEEFCNKIASYSNLPISYVSSLNSIKYEPLKYIEEFPKGDIGELLFDAIKQDTSTISLTQDNLGFKVNLKSFRDVSVEEPTSSIEVVDVYSRVKTALEDIDSSTLPIGEPYVVTTLSEKELSSIVNHSSTKVKDEDVVSRLTSNKVLMSIISTNLTFVDDVTLKFSLNVSINGYIINICVYVETSPGIYDFETCFYFKEEVSTGNVTYSGSTNTYVRKILGILNDTCKNIVTNQPKAFTSNSLADTFSINLEGISDELSDPTLVFAPKETRINSTSKQIEFVVTRMF